MGTERGMGEGRKATAETKVRLRWKKIPPTAKLLKEQKVHEKKATITPSARLQNRVGGSRRKSPLPMYQRKRGSVRGRGTFDSGPVGEEKKRQEERSSIKGLDVTRMARKRSHTK